ncbi:hypothetical protein N7468_009278 [Penicillium chermesinum]|uniref:Uncharacterized protein n=1 Tax=Penicillium chermesinum TaxID=63820 RepID=A0A9W9NK01_9EURO|nr:uncharacterized protein N7468_009278 [Penicillium chermesinum]KAJ5220074.1 hypothetical protein N7468_009278 [Penicillium chermesinum]
MAQDISRLVREVERVVTAPYVPSLQDLYALVQTDARLKIRYWSTQKPCQVGLLVDVLVDALSRSRIALPLLSVFGSEVHFRDAFLRRHPATLAAFVERAAGTGDPEYISVSTTILSQPLPSGFIPPMRIADLITMLVSRVAEEPRAENVLPLHSIMNGLQGSLLIRHEIPLEVMGKMQLEFTKALRNLDDHMGNLLCLATFARIVSPQCQNIGNQHGPEAPSWLLNIQHFFGPKRGLKTLDLVVLRVILACSVNCNNLAPSQAAESIRLAICIADAIDPEQKQAWMSTNSPKIAKLCEKVARDDLDQEVQMMGVAFLLCIFPVANLPSHTRELGLNVLLSKGSRGVMGVMPHHLIPRLAESVTQTDGSVIYHLLRFVFEAVQNDALPDRNSLSDLHLSGMILSGLQNSKSPVLSSAILDSVSTQQTIANILEAFPIVSSQAQCEGLETCHIAKVELQNKILLTLFEIYFAAVLTRSGDDQGVIMMKAFVDRSASSLSNGICRFSVSCQSSLRGQASLNSLPNLPSSQVPRDWRTCITESFKQNAQESHQTLMEKIEEVCYDLERRCYEVEAPLRLAEAECDRKILETEVLLRQKEQLEKKLEEAAQVLSDLRQEVNDQEENTESMSGQIKQLSMSLNAARSQLEAQSNHSEEIIRQEKEQARTRELDLIAISTEKDDQIEDLQEEVHRLHSEKAQVQQALDNAAKEQAILSTTLRHEVAELKEQLEKSSRVSARKEDEIKRHQADAEDMRMEMETMKTMAEQQTLEAERFRSTLQEVEAKSRLEMGELKAKHGIENNQVHEELEHEKEKNERLLSAMHEATHNAANEVQMKNKHIAQLERKIQLLHDERAAKAREFSEAQEHIGRLMNVMGFVPQQQIPATSSKHQRAKSSERKSSRDTGKQAYDEEETHLAESFDTMAFDPRERSPKRPKGNSLSTNLDQLLPPKTPLVPRKKNGPEHRKPPNPFPSEASSRDVLQQLQEPRKIDIK